MNTDEIAALLKLSAQAYDILLHVASLAGAEPQIFDKEARETLATRRGWRVWLTDVWPRLPENLRRPVDDPSEPSPWGFEALCNLLWSFFEVSFRLELLSWQGATLESRVKLGSGNDKSPKPRLLRLSALRKLARSRGLRTSDEVLRELVRDEELRPALSTWTYLWGLRQRAAGKAKGSGLRAIWRSMPEEARKTLSPEMVEAAVEEIESALRARLGGRAT